MRAAVCGLIQHKTAEVLSTIYEGLLGLLKRIRALPWATQLALIVAIVLAISPKWATTAHLFRVKALK
jgi:hypothetical protein